MDRIKRMKHKPAYNKQVEKIRKEEFLSFYGSCEPAKWFSDKELQVFPFPGRAQSLAGRYLIKKAISNFLEEKKYMHEIEIFNDDLGKPEIILGEHIHRAMIRKGVRKVECSLSHSRNYIAGMTIFCF
jgi:phosphopantetheinyl transferase (holo-ACP synthase)